MDGDLCLTRQQYEGVSRVAIFIFPFQSHSPSRLLFRIAVEERIMQAPRTKFTLRRRLWGDRGTG